MRVEGLRPAHPEDAEALSALIDAAYGHYVARIGKPPGPMLENYAQIIIEHEAWVVPGEPGDLAAALVLVPADGHLLVQNVAVAPVQQGRGIGRALLEFAASRAAQLGVPEMRLYTHEKMTENIALYTRLGWEETHRAVEDGFARVFFRKAI